MKKLASLALVAALTLGGCATNPLTGNSTLLPTITNPVTDTRFASIESSYGIALAAANSYIQNYRGGNRCTVSKPESVSNLCSRRSVVLKMQSAIRDASVALGQARGFIQRNPTLDATSVIDAAASAVATLQAISGNGA